jgi:hypothetical protein
MKIDIVELIEKNPLTKLSSNYNSKLITKIKENFTEAQQQLFVAGFYNSLKFNQKKDFVIDFDDVWKWLGYTNKANAKKLLEKYFTISIDYVIIQNNDNELNGRGGHNKEVYMISIKTFKLFCIKANTIKSSEIHEYYVLLEEILKEIADEESEELRLQLESIKIDSEKNKLDSELEKYAIREKTLLEQYPKNVQCIYYGIIDNKSISNEKLIKFGNSNDVNSRVDCHKKTYSNFRLMNIFKVSNKLQIENAIKQHKTFKKKRRNITIDDLNYTELLAIDDLTFDEIDKMIKQIIDENEYNIENYNKLLETNRLLELKNNEIMKENNELIESNDLLKSKMTVIDQEMNLDIKTKNQFGRNFCLYAFKIKENQFRCGLCRPIDLEKYTKTFKDLHSEGEMVLTSSVSNHFTDKIFHFMLSNHLTRINKHVYDGIFGNIKLIFEIVLKLETELTEKNASLSDILNQISKSKIIDNNNIDDIDPEVPSIRKARRAIDQINVETGAVIANFVSIEEAGRQLCCSGSAVGIALRNKTLCLGFKFRYANISHDDQYAEQPVIKVCCTDGVNTHFENIADAAKDARISAPGLRNRILTKVHVDNYHWIFDKNSSHYK